MSADEIADTLISTTDCKQGAVRAVRFSGNHANNFCMINIYILWQFMQ